MAPRMRWPPKFLRHLWASSRELCLFLRLMVENRRSPVEVGRWNPSIYRVLYIPGGCLGFLPSTVANVMDVGKNICLDLFVEGKDVLQEFEKIHHYHHFMKYTIFWSTSFLHCTREQKLCQRHLKDIFGCMTKIHRVSSAHTLGSLEWQPMNNPEWTIRIQKPSKWRWISFDMNYTYSPNAIQTWW